MFKNHQIAVVIPAFNEEKKISQVVDSIPDYVDHIIIIDDCSQDNTPNIISNLKNKNISYLRNDKNNGVGFSMVRGYELAMDLNNDLMIKIDGDGQMDPSHLPGLLDALIVEKFDYVKGNRFIAEESLAFMPRHRLIGNIIVTFMNKLATGYWNIFDPQNGFTGISSGALKAINLKKIHRGYFFENDMLFQLNILEKRVKDLPIPAIYGDENSSLSPLKAGSTFPFLFLSRFFVRIYQKYILRDFSPIAIFLFFGILLSGWGFSFGLFVWIKNSILGVLTPTGTIMFSLLPLILGFQLILQAIVLDIQGTPK